VAPVAEILRPSTDRSGIFCRMFPLLSVIIAVMAGLSYFEMVREPEPPSWIGVGAVVLLTGAVAKLIGDVLVRRVLADREAAGSLALRSSFLQRILVLAAYFVVVFRFDWPMVVVELGIGDWVLLDEIVILLPFGVMLVLSLVACWWAETRLDLHEFTAGAYLKFQLRQYQLPLLPFAFFILVKDLVEFGSRSGVRWLAELVILLSAYPYLQWLALILGLLLLYCLVPSAMRRLWGMKPLPPGTLRDRLDAYSRREGFKAREILVWPTGQNVMNAAVIGLAGPIRYVILTDALISTLKEDEVEAVFAHEVGHAKHHHMMLFLLFIVGYTLLTFLVVQVLSELLPASVLSDPVSGLLFAIGSILVWFGILFGFVSRRFEQQADVHGALSTGRGLPEGSDPGEHPFVRALEGLAVQMGDIREVKGWRHFSLAERIRFLTEFLSDERVRHRYRRGMASLLVFFLGLLLALGAAAAATVPDQLVDGGLKAHALRAQWFRQQGREAEAEAENQKRHAYALRKGIRLDLRLYADPGRLRDARQRALSLLRYSRLEYPGDAEAESIAALLGVPGLGEPPPSRADRLLYLADAYLAIGELSAARDALQDALRVGGEHPVPLTVMGEILRREGRPEGARLALEAALALVPPDGADAAFLRKRIAAIE